VVGWFEGPARIHVLAGFVPVVIIDILLSPAMSLIPQRRRCRGAAWIEEAYPLQTGMLLGQRTPHCLEPENV